MATHPVDFSPILGKRKAILISLGFIQMCCGVALITIGCWALSELSQEFQRVNWSPIWIGFIFATSGYSALSIKAGSGKRHLIITGVLSIVALLAAMVISNWYFVLLLRTEDSTVRLFYVVSIILCIVEIVLGAGSTTIAFILKARYEIDALQRCRERGYINRAAEFSAHDFAKLPRDTEAPPPYVA